MSLEQRISDWTKGSLSDGEFGEALDRAMATLLEHREGYSRTEAGLSDAELAHCANLRDYLWDSMDRMELLLEQLFESVQRQDRSTVISIGDQLSRASYQLDLALKEFRNQVLLVRGPTEIPNLNLLFSLKSEYDSEPTPAVRERFLQVLQSERDSAFRGLSNLEKSNGDSRSSSTLIGAFREHLSHLKALADTLYQRPDEDLTGHLLQVNLTYTEIHRLLPLVAAEQSHRGETPFQELNLILAQLERVKSGELSDHLLLESVYRIEDGIEELSGDLCQDVREAFSLACSPIYEFLESRDVTLLSQAQQRMLEFASALEETPTPEFQPETVPVVTDRLATIYQAVDDILLCKIQEQAYLDTLDDFGL